LDAELTELDSPRAKRAVQQAIQSGDLHELERLPAREKRSLLELIEERLNAGGRRPDPRAIVELAGALSLLTSPDATLATARPGR
jgi:hypothetical protein